MSDSPNAMHRIKAVTEKGKGALIHLEDGSKPIWTPDYGVAVALIGKPIPEDWVRKDGEYGPQAFPPKAGKGGGGYRASKEAFDREAESRREWQIIEEDRRDRRTALMQAVIVNTQRDAVYHGMDDVLQTSEAFYDWLKDHETSVATSGKLAADIGGGGAQDPKTAPAPSTYPVDRADCNHKTAAGHWVKWVRIAPDFRERCPKCGTPMIVAMEGTTEDLGSA